MNNIKPGDWLYCFMGESLIHFVVTMYNLDIDPKRVVGEDASNEYTFYVSDCYATKEAAISGMLDYIRGITECDCGEDEEVIDELCRRMPNCS